MNPVDKIREQRRNTLLQGLAARPHPKKILPLDAIRSIGIIAHGLNDQEQIALSQFTHHLTARGTMVRKIELPSYADELLDKSGLPKSDFTQFFTSYHYDLLINTTSPEDLFGLYVTLNTESNMRVIYHDTSLPLSRLNEDTYDLIIRSSNPFDLTRYLTELLNLLVNIRKQ